jgi:hypothetical protein
VQVLIVTLAARAGAMKVTVITGAAVPSWTLFCLHLKPASPNARKKHVCLRARISNQGNTWSKEGIALLS